MAELPPTSKMARCQCRWCGGSFEVARKAAARGRGRFCTRDCSCAYNRNRRWQVLKRPVPPRPKTPVEERYERHVIRRSEDECWDWSAFKHDGYGRIDDGSGRSVGAHRVSYEMHVGPIPEGMDVLHRCDEAACTNPRHLFTGTNRDNTQDRDRKGRTCVGQNHPMAKLTTQAVREIRAKMPRRGAEVRRFAARFGVTPSAIRHARDRRNWKHVA